jgi:hypothetical protein
MFVEDPGACPLAVPGAHRRCVTSAADDNREAQRVAACGRRTARSAVKPTDAGMMFIVRAGRHGILQILDASSRARDLVPARSTHRLPLRFSPVAPRKPAFAPLLQLLP